jgi:hypothetical protein
MTTLRTHFTFRVDTWTPDGESIVEHLAGVEAGLIRYRRGQIKILNREETDKLMGPACRTVTSFSSLLKSAITAAVIVCAVPFDQ